MVKKVRMKYDMILKVFNVENKTKKICLIKKCKYMLQGVSFEILRLQMAVVPKLCISDPKLVKSKCV